MASILELITRRADDEEILAVAGNRPPVPRAVDPDALGKIRNIVKSAHKWGGDGRRPKFRKIRRVLLSKHPEVISKAFGGNPDVAAAWIKNNWYRMRGMAPPPTRGKGSAQAEMFAEVPWYQEVDLDDDFEFPEDSIELFCTITEDTESKDGLEWTPMLRTGSWATSPIRGRRGPWTCTLQDLQEIQQAFEEKAWEFVTVPMSKAGGSNHIDDAVYDNTGFVEAVAIRPDTKREGQHVLWGGIRFTEPDALGLVRRGTVRGGSVNVKFNLQHQESGKVYPKVLTHFCLTNQPFVNGLNAFSEKLAASRTEQDVRDAADELGLVSYELEDAPASLEDFLALAKGDVAYDTSLDFSEVQSAIQEQLGQYYVDAEGDVAPVAGGKDSAGQTESAYAPGNGIPYEQCLYVRGITPDQALVCRGGYSDEGWVVGYDVNAKGDVTIDPPDEWVSVQQEWVELTRFFAPCEELRAEDDADPTDEELESWDDGADVWLSADEAQAELSAAKPIHFTGTATRKKLAKKGIALPDGSFPIPNVDFLKRAIRAIGRAKDRAKAIAHIRKRAKALGATNLLPQTMKAELPTEPTIVIIDSLEGGDRMAAENGTQEDTPGEVRMTRDDLQTMIAEAIQADRSDRDAETQQLRATVESLQSTNRTLEIERKVQELNGKKLPPAFVTKAEELLAARPTADGFALTRTPEGGEAAEVTLSIVDVIDELAATVPQSLEATQTKVGQQGKPADGEKTPEEKAAELLAEIQGGDVVVFEDEQ